MSYIRIFWGVFLITLGTLSAFGKEGMCFFARDSRARRKSAERRLLYRNLGELVIVSGILFLLKGLWPEAQEHGLLCAMTAFLIVAALDIACLLRDGQACKGSDAARR